MIGFETTIDPVDFDAATNEAVSNDDVIAILNGLIEVCKDGQEGFVQAAEAITNPGLKNKFFEYGQQRGQFARDLQILVRDLGGDPEKSGSFSGAIHRGWINVKSLVAGNDENSVLNEAERGEDIAKSAYQKAIQSDLPPNVHILVSNQFNEIQAAHDHIKLMRDADNKFVQSAGN